jgi:hypothetical protein
MQAIFDRALLSFTDRQTDGLSMILRDFQKQIFIVGIIE